MPRSGWLSIGAVAAAWAGASLGIVATAAASAIVGAVAVVAWAAGWQQATRTLPVIVIGAGVILVRAWLWPASVPIGALPAGDGPWTFIVESAGGARDGKASATLRLVEQVPSGEGTRIAATLPPYPEIAPGDRLTASGRMRPPPESSYGDYLERIGAVGTFTARSMTVEHPPPSPNTAIETARQGAAAALVAVLPEPEAGLAAGILIGLRDRVDRDLAAAFTTAGVSHVVAISGWNIAIVAAAVAAAFGRMRRRRRSIATMVAIVAYVAFAGASASVVRAGAMAGIVLLARESGRAGRAAAALGWAVTLLLVAEPRLVEDAGFQLSALATAGLIAWATPLTAWIARTAHGRVPGWLAESLGVSFAAQAATLPVVLVSFGRLAVLSPLVNLVVVPLVAPVMAAGLLAMAGGALALAGGPAVLGTILSVPGWVGLRIMVALVDAAASVPFASVTLPPPIATTVAAVTVTVIVGVHLHRSQGAVGLRSTSPRPAMPAAPDATSASAPGRGTAAKRATPARSRSTTWSVALLIGTLVVAGAVTTSRSGGVARVTVLDVGQGDAILVEGSRGGRLLIDGGPDPSRLMVVLDGRIPPWDRRLDAVILTHPHEDHVAGLARLLARYRVGRVFEPGMRGPGPGYAEWSRRLAASAAPVRLGLAAGDRLSVDDIDLRVLWPIRGRVPTEPPDGGTGINNVSIVLLGTVATFHFMLAGDVEEAIDPSLLADHLPHLDLLKVAHHGSRTATTQAFVDAVRPRIAIASAGTGNPYGHPARATLDRLAAAGARVFRTDLDGTVAVTFAPTGLEVNASGGRATVPISKPAATALAAFRCAIAAAALLPEREAPSTALASLAVRRGGTPSVGYHRSDDGPDAGRSGLPPALPRSPDMARASFARGRGGRRVPCGADRGAWRCRGPAARGERRPAPRHRQGAPDRRSGSRAPPWRRLGRLADAERASRTGAGGGEPPRHAAARRRPLPELVRVRDPGGTDRGLRGQTSRTAPGVDGRALPLVAASVSPRRYRWRSPGLRVERGGPANRPCPGGAPRGGRLPCGGRRTSRGPSPGLDLWRPPVGAGHRLGRMTTSPLAYFWGDDDFAMGRHVARLAADLATEGGEPLERWDLRGQRNGYEALLGQLRERTATPVMFGGGTLAVVTNVGALTFSNEGRDAVLGVIGTLAPGNALVILDITKSGARGPTKVGLATAVTKAGGVVRECPSPRADGLAGWVTREAHDRGIALAPGAAKELATRLGGFVEQKDIERPFLTRTASSELDKLALYRAPEPITVDDVRALVAEAVPGTIWGFVDAVGERRSPQAVGLLDDLIETTPEPVLLVMLHRRMRDLIEIGDRLGMREPLPAVAKAMGMKSEYRVRMLAAQARNWTAEELTDALQGLLELDAMVKHAPGSNADESQRRLAFTLWVMDHVPRRGRRTA